ncbi:hypothetical protein GOBAR_AA35442 [Gossypium barbadense]|uniref:Uncharacterized protein n=1 Tax=Gossypium barbadense TaxID=3634 RepID=A0A2P5W2C9_GOSBA|nr:hypothetical protein GOBAR_AA35442 [Gossypium barbadense]
MFPLAGIQYRLHVVKKATVPASKKRKGASSSSSPTAKVRHPFLRFPIGPQEELFQILWGLTFNCGPMHRLGCNRTSLVGWCDSGPPNHRPLGAFLWDHRADLSIPEFDTVLGLYTEEFKEKNDLHRSPSQCWDALVPGGATYNPSRSKVSALPPSLRYLHAILAHTITGRREGSGVVNTHDTYFLWFISYGHVIDLAYFIGLAIQHQMEWHRKGLISIGPYVTQLARHFGLLSTAAQESSLTLIGLMSPQGISSMLSTRMIEKIWTNEPLPPLEYPPPLSHRLLSKTPVRGIHHTGKKKK